MSPFEGLRSYSGTWPTRLKLYALGLLIVLGARHAKDVDPSKCAALAHGGTWMDGESMQARWDGRGCKARQYDKDAIEACAAGRHVLLAGDLQMRSVYDQITYLLNQTTMDDNTTREADAVFEAQNLSIHFLYSPTLNESRVRSLLDDYRMAKSQVPTVTVLGAGTRAVQTASVVDYLEVVSELSGMTGRTPLQNGIFNVTDGPGDMILFAPADSTAAPDLNGRTQNLNDQLRQLSEHGRIDYLQAFDEMAKGQPADMLSQTKHGILEDPLYAQQAQLILNLRCNARIASLEDFPNEIMCCSSRRRPNWLQLMFLSLALIVLPVCSIAANCISSVTSSTRRLVQALAEFTIAIAVAYFADRTAIFEQVRKNDFLRLNFWLPMAIALLIGLIYVGCCNRSRSLSQDFPDTNNTPVGCDEKWHQTAFLPREQTEEWRGWMQIMIIVYRYNLSYLYSDIWQIIRACVASYLFLTGFGHTMYHLQTDKFELSRFVHVLIRINLLPVALTYVLRTHWTLYYYMPLCTLWFTITWLVLFAGHQYNRSRIFVLGKIAIAAILVTVILDIERMTETLVVLFAYLTRGQFDPAFFPRRVRGDRFAPFVGMVFAIVYIWFRDQLDNPRSPSRMGQLLRRSVFPLTILATCSSLVIFIAFWKYSYEWLWDRDVYTSWQPYITWIPIISFIILRNATPVLRAHYSRVFSWLGKYSGEMYVLQHHLWLAGDQSSILRTGFFHGNETLLHDRWRDIVLISPVYLTACMMVGDATKIIADWFVSEPRKEAEQRGITNTTLIIGEEGDDEPLLSSVATKRSSGSAVGALFNQLPRTGLLGRTIAVLGLLWLLNLTYT